MNVCCFILRLEIREEIQAPLKLFALPYSGVAHNYNYGNASDDVYDTELCRR